MFTVNWMEYRYMFYYKSREMFELFLTEIVLLIRNSIMNSAEFNYKLSKFENSFLVTQSQISN